MLSAQADIALGGGRFICPMILGRLKSQQARAMPTSVGNGGCPRRRTSPGVAANSFAQLS